MMALMVRMQESVMLWCLTPALLMLVLAWSDPRLKRIIGGIGIAVLLILPLVIIRDPCDYLPWCPW